MKRVSGSGFLTQSRDLPHNCQKNYLQERKYKSLNEKCILSMDDGHTLKWHFNKNALRELDLKIENDRVWDKFYA